MWVLNPRLESAQRKSASATLPDWTDWKMVGGTNREEAKVYGLRVVSGRPLIPGDRIQVCAADSMFACTDTPPRFMRPTRWVRAQSLVGVTIRPGDTMAFHPMAFPDGTTLWARVYKQGPVPRLTFRLIYGGAYGWSEPEESWEIQW